MTFHYFVCQIRAYPVSHERHADIYVYLYNFYVEGVEGMENDTNNNPKPDPDIRRISGRVLGPGFVIRCIGTAYNLESIRR